MNEGGLFSGAASPSLRVRVATCALVLVGLAVVPNATAEVQEGTSENLVIKLQAKWPHSLRRAYQPLFVSVGNRASETRSITVVVEGRTFRNRTFRVVDRFESAPGAVVDREMVIPVPLDSKVNVSVLDGGAAGWNSRIEVGKGMPDRHYAMTIFLPQDETSNQRVVGLLGVLLPNGQAMRFLDYDLMPRRLASYTSLDVVVLDLEFGSPPSDRLATLLAFARLGGRVILLGLEASKLRTSFPEFAPYLDPKRRKHRGLAAETYPCGFGHLLVTGGVHPDFREKDAAALDAFFDPLSRANPGSSGRFVVPMTGLAVPRFAPEELLPLAAPAIATPSREALIGLLFVFSVLVGPVSFLLARRTGTPLRMFVFSPMFASAGVLAMFGVTLYERGLGVKGVARTFTYLDQRIDRSTTLEMRALHAEFAGSFVLDGAFGAGIADYESFVAVKSSSFRSPTLDNEPSPQQDLDVSSGLHHAGAFLPARWTVRQLALLDAPTRRRIDLRHESNDDSSDLLATNGLATSIRHLVVRLGEHDYRVLRHDEASAPTFEPGTTRVLQRLDVDRPRSLVELIPRIEPVPVAIAGADSKIGSSSPPARNQDPVHAWLQAADRELGIGEYFAVTAESAFETNPELEIEYTGGTHVVFGAFDPPAPGALR